MKNALIAAIVFVITAFSSITIADDHAVFTGGMDPQQPMNAQTQLCTLNPGKTMAHMIVFNKNMLPGPKERRDYCYQSYPFISHDNPDTEAIRNSWVFSSDHKTSAKGKGLNTPEGKKLIKSGKVLLCDLKMATVYTRWADVDAMNSKNRLAMWNWCD